MRNWMSNKYVMAVGSGLIVAGSSLEANVCEYGKQRPLWAKGNIFWARTMQEMKGAFVKVAKTRRSIFQQQLFLYSLRPFAVVLLTT
jgi:hypothetical protein